jgi:hypothetical protein
MGARYADFVGTRFRDPRRIPATTVAPFFVARPPRQRCRRICSCGKADQLPGIPASLSPGDRLVEAAATLHLRVKFFRQLQVPASCNELERSVNTAAGHMMRLPVRRAPLARPTHGSFIAEVVINYGPAELLGRLFLAADTAARDRGVLLSFATLGELVEINKANRASWLPLLPVFDPGCGHFDQSSAICLLGRDDSGDVVVTQAARFFDWERTSFYEEATSLRMLYHDAHARRQGGEALEVTAPSARKIAGKVSYTGAHWCRPDYRGKGLPGITPRIARALAIALWDIDFACTLMLEDVFSRGVARRAGYLNSEWSVELKNTPLGTYTAALLWNDRSEMVADLEDFLANFVVAQAGIVERYA